MWANIKRERIPDEILDRDYPFRNPFNEDFIKNLEDGFDHTNLTPPSIFTNICCVDHEEILERWLPEYIRCMKEFLSNKKHCDMFFYIFKSEYYVLHILNLSHWLRLTDISIRHSRYTTWNQIKDTLKSVCHETYGCKWGKQTVEFIEDIPPFEPLVPCSRIGDFLNLMKNRPLYRNDEFLGYVKGHKDSVIICHKLGMKFDDENELVDDFYTTEYFGILMYKKDLNERHVHFNPAPFVLVNRVSDIEVKEDRVLIH